MGSKFLPCMMSDVPGGEGQKMLKILILLKAAKILLLPCPLREPFIDIEQFKSAGHFNSVPHHQERNMNTGEGRGRLGDLGSAALIINLQGGERGRSVCSRRRGGGGLRDESF